MKEYYECHITMLGNPEQIKRYAEGVNWIFSKIDGDPNLGEGVKCYATRQYNINRTIEDIILELDSVSILIRQAAKAIILRKKIEKVIYDERIKQTKQPAKRE